VRALSLEVVHVALAGQGWHWLVVKRAAMSGAASGGEAG
jgi:superoxide dismutase